MQGDQDREGSSAQINVAQHVARMQEPICIHAPAADQWPTGPVIGLELAHDGLMQRLKASDQSQGDLLVITWTGGQRHHLLKHRLDLAARVVSLGNGPVDGRLELLDGKKLLNRPRDPIPMEIG